MNNFHNPIQTLTNWYNIVYLYNKNSHCRKNVGLRIMEPLDECWEGDLEGTLLPLGKAMRPCAREAGRMNGRLVAEKGLLVHDRVSTPPFLRLYVVKNSPLPKGTTYPKFIRNKKACQAP